ncbi:MAG TPA: hypothetical protein VGV14_18875, partial [Rhodanobacter sp.]|nr:hypothetical protein [Rhodanobacter sp.]
AIGAMAPFASGEAFFVGAGGEAVFGGAAANVFSGLTGTAAIVGTGLDPNAEHGFLPHHGCP